MLLYDTALAPNARRVRIFLAEKGIEIPKTDVDLLKLEHKTAEFTKLNPMQTVPTLLLDDGGVLSESVAICRYFEHLHPEPPLFGRNARDQVFVEMWQRRIEFGLFLRLSLAFLHTHPALAVLENSRFPEFGEVQRERGLKFLRLLDEELATRPFIAGDAYTIADITALSAMGIASLIDADIPTELTNLMRWREEVESRPSAKA